MLLVQFSPMFFCRWNVRFTYVPCQLYSAARFHVVCIKRLNIHFRCCPWVLLGKQMVINLPSQVLTSLSPWETWWVTYWSSDQPCMHVASPDKGSCCFSTIAIDHRWDRTCCKHSLAREGLLLLQHILMDGLWGGTCSTHASIHIIVVHIQVYTYTFLIPTDLESG